MLFVFIIVPLLPLLALGASAAIGPAIQGAKGSQQQGDIPSLGGGGVSVAPPAQTLIPPPPVQSISAGSASSQGGGQAPSLEILLKLLAGRRR